MVNRRRSVSVSRLVSAVFAVVTSLVATSAFAQGSDNPECLGSSCGRPQEQGGGCGNGGGSVWVNYTDDGVTLSYTDDADGDGKADDRDNCPFVSNRDQDDSDGDGVGNSCDNCGAASNFTQLDTDGDGKGDVCDDDSDGDGVSNAADNCPSIPNKDQTNTDAALAGADKLGDVCDDDDDADGFSDADDLCPSLNHTPNEVVNSPACRLDSDQDNIPDARDNCPGLANGNQADTDGDKIGDVCDLDGDGDGINDKKIADGALSSTGLDNCPLNKNRNQLDDDGDGLGDVCDAKYCVVVDKNNPADCLDPNGPFRVNAGGSIKLGKGEKLRLPLFANREGKAIEYTYTVSKRPAGSSAAVENPIGVASLSRHWEYAYTDGNVPTFTADVAGEYSIQLQGKLVVPDRRNPEVRESVSELRVESDVNNLRACSVGGFGGAFALLGVSLIGRLRRRKNEKVQ